MSVDCLTPPPQHTCTAHATRTRIDAFAQALSVSMHVYMHARARVLIDNNDSHAQKSCTQLVTYLETTSQKRVCTFIGFLSLWTDSSLQSNVTATAEVLRK